MIELGGRNAFPIEKRAGRVSCGCCGALGPRLVPLGAVFYAFHMFLIVFDCSEWCFHMFWGPRAPWAPGARFRDYITLYF